MSEIGAIFTSAAGPIGVMDGFLDPAFVVGEFEIEPGMSIADFGCGPGHFAISMAKKASPTGKVYAIDIQQSALDSVKMRIQMEGLDNIETIRANLEVLGGSGLMNESQDLVIMQNILFQSSKKSSIIKEAVRILKSRGRVIIIDWKHDSGFGPPASLRIDINETQKMAEAEGLKLEKELNVGRFYFGLMFRK